MIDISKCIRDHCGLSTSSFCLMQLSFWHLIFSSSDWRGHIRTQIAILIKGLLISRMLFDTWLTIGTVCCPVFTTVVTRLFALSAAVLASVAPVWIRSDLWISCNVSPTFCITGNKFRASSSFSLIRLLIESETVFRICRRLSIWLTPYSISDSCCSTPKSWLCITKQAFNMSIVFY